MYRRTGRQEDTSLQNTEGQVDRRPQVYRRIGSQEGTSLQKDRQAGGYKCTEGQVDRKPDGWEIGRQEDRSTGEQAQDTRQ